MAASSGTLHVTIPTALSAGLPQATHTGASLLVLAAGQVVGRHPPCIFGASVLVAHSNTASS